MKEVEKNKDRHQHHQVKVLEGNLHHLLRRVHWKRRHLQMMCQ